MIAPIAQAASLGFSNDKVPPSDPPSFLFASGRCLCRRRATAAVQAPMNPRKFTGYGPLVPVRNIAEALHLLAVVRYYPCDLLLG
jgi:hypothetical protein